MKKKRHLWLGPYSTKSIFQTMVSRGYRDAAAHNCQRNFITGFMELGVPIDTISSLGVQKSEVGIFERDINTNSGSEGVDIACCTGKKTVYNRPIQSIQLLQATTFWLKQLKTDEQPVIFVYSMQSLTLGVVRKLKRLHKTLRVVLIVPDLPQFMDLNMTRTKAVLKAIDWHLIKRLLKHVDYFVLFSAKMATFLQLQATQWCVIEGCAESRNTRTRTEQSVEKETFRVTYTGGLHRRYGVPRLLAAAKNMRNSDIQFIFSGDGDAVSDIVAASRIDPRISYRGFLRDAQSVAELQSTASVLINLRQPDEQASQYCFPSKIFEYMLSSRPVLSWRIGGIPDEYFGHLIEIPDTTTGSILQTLGRVRSMSESERSKIGFDARSFILNNKTPRVQVEKLLKHIASSDH